MVCIDVFSIISDWTYKTAEGYRGRNNLLSIVGMTRRLRHTKKMIEIHLEWIASNLPDYSLSSSLWGNMEFQWYKYLMEDFPPWLPFGYALNNFTLNLTPPIWSCSYVLLFTISIYSEVHVIQYIHPSMDLWGHLHI